MMSTNTKEDENSSSARCDRCEKKWKHWKFIEEKLVRGISRAGTPFIFAKDISKSLSSRLAENPSIDNHIYSNKFGEYIAQELKQRNQGTIADSHLRYSKNSVTPISDEKLAKSKYD